MGAYARDALLIPAEDGRVLEVELSGPPDGTPMFVHHGTPGAAGEFEPLVEIGAERNIRHVNFSRPGYGASGRRRGRTVASCASDVAAIADALNLARFYSMGVSGGGPHSIACAALLPDRVIAAVTIASVAPFDAPGLDWTAGMGTENLDEVAAARAGEHELHAHLERAAAEMRATTAEQLLDALGDVVTAADRRALTDALGEYMVRQTTRALSQGVWGWVDDDLALFADWGFELDQIRAPLSVWHGAKDRFVPIAHGEWLVEHTNANAHLRPDDGHLALGIGAYAEILDELIEG